MLILLAYFAIAATSEKAALHSEEDWCIQDIEGDLPFSPAPSLYARIGNYFARRRAEAACIPENPALQVIQGQLPWAGQGPKDFFNEYYNVFKSQNRNAASHKWASFVLDRSKVFDKESFTELFGSFCPISGSIVYKSDQKKYDMVLPDAAHPERERYGYMYYCCWPCLCDTQDFIRVDTKSVVLRNGVTEQFWFAVITNPCDDEGRMDEPWQEPFRGRTTTIHRSAPELRCRPDPATGRKQLDGAILSDHGYPIIGLFHDSVEKQPHHDCSASRAVASQRGAHFQGFHSYCDLERECTSRAEQGYNSGMGEIFRKVAEIGTWHKICPVGEPGTLGQAAASAKAWTHRELRSLVPAGTEAREQVGSVAACGVFAAALLVSAYRIRNRKLRDCLPNTKSPAAAV